MQRVHKALRQWYHTHGRRDLPWRNTDDPYHIYISEVMLQQTQVKTVLERYYAPFLEQFPTLRHLTQAKEQQVLKAWEGLGYYSRARNLHKAAKQCNGLLPETLEGLLALSGIGRNTAHAILAFGYHQPVPVMEANLKRVLSRVFALAAPSEAVLWDKAWELLDTHHPFDYNQAMMDIGAMLCTKRNPRCGDCPLQAICRGKHAPETFPAPRIKKAVPIRRKAIVVYACGGRYHLTLRKGKLLGGLYGFVEYEAGEWEALPHPSFVETLKPSHKGEAIKLGHITQVYSHFRLEADVYHLQLTGTVSGTSWKTFEAIRALPLSKADEKVLALLTPVRK